MHLTWPTRALALLALALAAGCRSSPSAVEERRAKREEAEGDLRNREILERLRELASAPNAPRRELFGAVEDLLSEDFETSTRAERTLVSAGREALPLLGEAVGLSRPVLGSRMDPAAALLREIHRGESVERLLEDLESPSAEIQVSAAEILAERDEVQALPSLVSRLRAREPRVVAAFAMAISRLSRRYFGPFDVGGEEDRAALVRRIENWFVRPNGGGSRVDPPLGFVFAAR